MITTDKEAAQILVDAGKLILSYKRVVKKKRPQRGKAKMKSKKYYKQNKQKLKKKGVKYRKKFAPQLKRTRKRKRGSEEALEVLSIAKSLNRVRDSIVV